MKYYAGIGSRKTPQAVLEVMTLIGIEMGKRGVTLRSGAAGGADEAFELGCDRVRGPKEIFLPWEGFNGRSHEEEGVLVTRNAMATEIAASTHPNWPACSTGARALHTRNIFQVLGAELDTPVNAVFCWTPFGQGQGGTGQAIRLAKRFNIPVVDMGHKDMSAASVLERLLKEFA